MTSLFQTELAINTRVVVAETCGDALTGRGHDYDPRHSVSATHLPVNSGMLIISKPRIRFVVSKDMEYPAPGSHSGSVGESPSPPPRAYFERDGPISKIIGLAENLKLA